MENVWQLFPIINIKKLSCLTVCQFLIIFRDIIQIKNILPGNSKPLWCGITIILGIIRKILRVLIFQELWLFFLLFTPFFLCFCFIFQSMLLNLDQFETELNSLVYLFSGFFYRSFYRSFHRSFIVSNSVRPNQEEKSKEI